MEKKILAKNRSTSTVGYTIPEDGIRREFVPGETKPIPLSEIEKLGYQPGGRAIVSNFLQITDPQVLEAFNVAAEPEYFLSEEQVKSVIKMGSLDQFLDMLDFAPEGVMQIVKRLAVELPMTDTQKMEALLNKTGFDVSKAIALKAADEADTGESAEKKTTTRRTTANYKIVSQG